MKSFFLFLLFIFFITQVHSEINTQLVNRIEKHFENIKNLRANFSEMIIPVIGDTQSFAGTINFARPCSLRMAIITPQEQLIVYNGTNAWLYLPKEKYCIKYRALSQNVMSKLPEYIFSPFKNLNVDSVRTVNNFICLHFSKKDKENFFDNLTLKISNDKLLPLSLELYDKTGNKTVYNFTDVRTNNNKKVNFTFSPPDDVLIIEK